MNNFIDTTNIGVTQHTKSNSVTVKLGETLNVGDLMHNEVLMPEQRVALVVSAFPLCGKTYEATQRPCGSEKILDSDSSSFSWIDASGIGLEYTRNPDFPKNYIEHIRDNFLLQDVIFVSSHDVVRKALHDAGIPFMIICPRRDRKAEWIERSVMRGDSNAFTKNLIMHWDDWINQIKYEQQMGTPVCWLAKGHHIADAHLSKKERIELILKLYKVSVKPRKLDF